AQSSVRGGVAVASLWKFTLNLRPSGSMTLASSPNASTRAGWNLLTCSPPPHDTRVASAATAASVAARRTHGRHPSRENIMHGISRQTWQRIEERSRGRGAAQAIAHAFPFRRGRRLLDPDELRAFGIELAQHGKQLMGRIGGPLGHHAVDHAR